MEKPRSLKRYRFVDLALFSIMLLVFESIIVTASLRWFPGQPYTVSLIPAIVSIVLVRWGVWAAVHALMGGILLCFLQGASLPQYVIYGIGNLFPLLLLPLLRRWRREKGVFSDAFSALAFGLAVLLLIQAGRAVLSLFFGANPSLALGCFTTESVTDLFTLVILWIVRRLDGLLEDQNHYLQRIQQEEQT